MTDFIMPKPIPRRLRKPYLEASCRINDNETEEIYDNGDIMIFYSDIRERKLQRKLNPKELKERLELVLHEAFESARKIRELEKQKNKGLK